MSGSTPLARRAWIPLVFLGLAAWFFWDAGLAMPVLPAPVSFDTAEIAPVPPRPDILERPEIVVGGYVQRCSACHDLFESAELAPADLRQHEHIVLDHGLNARCLNCHSPNDRNKLILQGSEEVEFSEVVKLCAKCHGPTYRDWEKGVHGRTMGSWDLSSGKHYRLKCIECHDPHAPAYADYRPLPGPNTLRAGDRDRGVHSDVYDPENPLMRWYVPQQSTPDESGAEETP